VECFLICWRFFVKKIGKIKINHANMSNKCGPKNPTHRILYGCINRINWLCVIRNLNFLKNLKVMNFKSS